jgi:hypothetical protein
MQSIEMKEIRIPTDMVRERRPSILFLLLRTTFFAILLSVISFFALNALGIAAIGIAGAIKHHAFDFSLAYRRFAAPTAAVLFVLFWTATLVFSLRERRRS